MKTPKPSPCSECPFRRAAAPGWLGAATAEDFVAVAKHEQLPCHAEVDYEDPEWRETLQAVHQCSGQAIFLKNHCVLPRDSRVKLLPADREMVFSHTDQFLEHHKR